VSITVFLLTGKPDVIAHKKAGIVDAGKDYIRETVSLWLSLLLLWLWLWLLQQPDLA